MMSDVDWSSVAPALITGVVGIAGVAGTVLSARISATSSTERDLQAEKRKVYARLDKAGMQVTTALWKRVAAGDVDDESSVREALDEAIREHAGVYSELKLIAPPDVVQAAFNVGQFFQGCAKTVPDEGYFSRWNAEYPDLSLRLVNTMRKDLNIGRNLSDPDSHPEGNVS